MSRQKLEALAAKWRKEIADYDDASVGSADPEDWMAGHRECLRELVDVIATLPEDAGWRPIESAPKTGESIILGYTGSHSAEGFWMADQTRNHWRETGWFETDSNILCDHPCTPDCWQPLPAAPATGQEG